MTELVLGMLENGKSVSPALMSGLVKKWGEVPESSGSEDTTGTAGTAGGNSYLNNGATSSGGYSYLGDGGNSPASPALDEEYWSGTDTRGYFTVDADGTAEPTSKGKNKGLNNTGAAYMRAIESYIEGNEAQGAATTNEIANFINTNILPYQYDREQLRRVCDIYGISTYGI